MGQESYHICINMGGICIRLDLYTEKTGEFFIRYLLPEKVRLPLDSVSSEEINWEKMPREKIIGDPFMEYTYIMVPVSDHLLRFGRCIFHGVSFLWQNTAYIFAGPSGVGKTTLYRKWKELFSDEIHIMNGDKPILEYRKNGAFYVHPSPWRGKEGLGSGISAELGGIILLDQSLQNDIRRMKPGEAVLPIYGQMFKTEETKENIQNCIQFEEALLEHIPVWKLSNRADAEAIMLIRDSLTGT